MPKRSGGSNSGDSMHVSKLIRSFSLKALRRAFADMKLRKDGTDVVSEAEFRAHIHKTSPALDAYAHGMYEKMRHAGHVQGASSDDDEDKLDYQQYLVALFGYLADKDGVDDLLRRSDEPEKEHRKQGPSQAELDATSVFGLWNTSGTGRLTIDEAEEGLKSTILPKEDVEDALMELYVSNGNPGFYRAEEVSLEEFTRWFINAEGLGDRE